MASAELRIINIFPEGPPLINVSVSESKEVISALALLNPNRFPIPPEEVSNKIVSSPLSAEELDNIDKYKSLKVVLVATTPLDCIFNFPNTLVPTSLT